MKTYTKQAIVFLAAVAIARTGLACPDVKMFYAQTTVAEYATLITPKAAKAAVSGSLVEQAVSQLSQKATGYLSFSLEALNSSYPRMADVNQGESFHPTSADPCRIPLDDRLLKGCEEEGMRDPTRRLLQCLPKPFGCNHSSTAPRNPAPHAIRIPGNSTGNGRKLMGQLPSVASQADEEIVVAICVGSECTGFRMANKVMIRHRNKICGAPELKSGN